MRPETSATFTLPLARLLEDQNCNIRIFYGDIDQLAVELMTEGQREPIKVREQAGEYYVVDGHRRQRALLRSLQLRIAAEEGKFLVYEGGKPLREAAGPQHPRHDPQKVLCQLVECGDADRLFASSLVHNLGKPFTFLERNLFLSRLLRQGGRAAEALALKIGFSLADISAARRLYAADPRLLEQVRLGRVSQKLALRILRTYAAVEQIARIKGARAAAEAQGRDQLLAEDFEWGALEEEAAERAEIEEESGVPADAVHARLNELVVRLGDAAQSAPNAAAEDRLATLLLVYRYAIGQIGYNQLEAHLLGRQ